MDAARVGRESAVCACPEEPFAVSVDALCGVSATSVVDGIDELNKAFACPLV